MNVKYAYRVTVASVRFSGITSETVDGKTVGPTEVIMDTFITVADNIPIMISAFDRHHSNDTEGDSIVKLERLEEIREIPKYTEAGMRDCQILNR